jgi:hypothetical protein
MTAVASELERVLQSLDPQRAARCERLVRDVLALLEESSAPLKPGASGYKLPAHSFGLREGIDPTKLGQLVDDL